MYYDDLKLEPIRSECGDDLFFDADGDGLDLETEFLRGTDPCNPDTDFDGVLDGIDNCPNEFNPEQLDSDGDGIGDACDDDPIAFCPVDLDFSGDIGFGDLIIVLTGWGPCPFKAPCPSDLDGSGDTGFGDLLIVISSWGLCE